MNIKAHAEWRQMTGADLSFVTVGRSLTVAKGFPPLRRNRDYQVTQTKKQKEIQQEPYSQCITHPRNGGFDVPFDNDAC